MKGQGTFTPLMIAGTLVLAILVIVLIYVMTTGHFPFMFGIAEKVPENAIPGIG
jgi:hypothetical protein